MEQDYLDSLGGGIWYGNWTSHPPIPPAFQLDEAENAGMGDALEDDGIRIIRDGKPFFHVLNAAGYNWCATGADSIVLVYEPESRTVLFTSTESEPPAWGRSHAARLGRDDQMRQQRADAIVLVIAAVPVKAQKGGIAVVAAPERAAVIRVPAQGDGGIRRPLVRALRVIFIEQFPCLRRAQRTNLLQMRSLVRPRQGLPARPPQHRAVCASLLLGRRRSEGPQFGFGKGG